ncbi:MAG TPA: hypothetical protein VGR47_18290 [Terracidiphilus sp.]|nr:hypothetical protein [Terracidiphilus sp.]
MFTLTTIANARRQNLDGTTDAIGSQLFLTVITASWEGAFNAAEEGLPTDANVQDHGNKMNERGNRP